MPSFRVDLSQVILTDSHDSLSTVVGYVPIIRPEPPSIARQIAYLENMPLPGPEADPHGWLCLDPLQIRGSVFSTREVDAKCTVRSQTAPYRVFLSVLDVVADTTS